MYKKSTEITDQVLQCGETVLKKKRGKGVRVVELVSQTQQVAEKENQSLHVLLRHLGQIASTVLENC